MNTQNKRIGVALIGAGMIGQTHVAAISDTRDILRLMMIVSRRPERAGHLADHYAGTTPRFTNEIAEITDNPDIQMVIVATPPSVRIDLIKQLAEAGKHILLEKPVARNLQEATQVVEICENAGVKLGMVFQHRMWPTSKAATAYVTDGKLGKLGHVEISAPLWRDQSYYDELGRGTYERDGGGVMLTQAIHTIDLALSLTGDITRVQAMTATTPLHQMEAEDFAIAGLHFASGAVGSLTTSTASFPQRGEFIALHFEQASLMLTKQELTVTYRDGRIARETYDDGVDNGPIVTKHQWHQGIIEDFATAITNNRNPLVTGRQGLASHRLIDAIERSSQTGRMVTRNT